MSDKITHEISEAVGAGIRRREPLRHIRQVKWLPGPADADMGRSRRPSNRALCGVYVERVRPDNELDLATAGCKKCIREHKRETAAQQPVCPGSGQAWHTGMGFPICHVCHRRPAGLGVPSPRRPAGRNSGWVGAVPAHPPREP